MTGGGLRDALENPQDAPELAQPGDAGPELGDGKQYERPAFPVGCPVTPLGVSSDLSGSQKCYYLNWNRQMAALEASNRHGKNSLIHLFGPSSDWLEAEFPQWSKPVREYDREAKTWTVIKESEIVGFDQAAASRALIEECVRKGPFDPAGKIRGPGAHRQRGGGLVLHCGDKLLVSQHTLDGSLKGWEWTEAGYYDGFVYTAAAKLPRPHHEPAHPRCAEKLLSLLMTWHWKRPLLDPRFLLGAIGASMIGGAVPWRPNVWITGGRGTGKSTLNGGEDNGVLDEIFGDAQFKTSAATAASIRQTLKNSTVPVRFDEMEAAEDNRKGLEVIEQARISSSGGKMHRGGSDQNAHEFTLRSVFWFSSILIPPLKPQDRSRLVVLELKPLKEGATPPDLPSYRLPQLGAQLQRRMIDGWQRLEATKAKYHAALSAGGHDNRACDQFGTLLACADVLLEDHDTPDGLPDDELVAHFAGMCRPDRMAELADEQADHFECLQHVLTSEVQARGGDERVSLGHWIGEAVAYEMAPLFKQDDPRAQAGDERADKRLQQMGLKLVNAQVKDSGGWGACAFERDRPAFLAIADNHQALSRLFAGTPWQSKVWKQSLGRCPGAIERVDVKFGHVKSRAVLVPLHWVLDAEELPNASQRETAEQWLEEHRKRAEA